MDYDKIPDETKEELSRYAWQRFQPGGFITAVLANDLMGAIGRADHDNIQCIPEICSYVYNVMPANCHGNMGIVNDWLQFRDHRE